MNYFSLKKQKWSESWTQSCPTLCDHTDCSPPGSSVHGILQARILEWVDILFSRGPSWPRNQTQVSCIAGGFFICRAIRKALVPQLYMILCDSMDCSPTGFSVHGIIQVRITEWIAISFSRGSSRPGIKPKSPTLQADCLLAESPGKPQEYFSLLNNILVYWSLNVDISRYSVLVLHFPFLFPSSSSFPITMSSILWCSQLSVQRLRFDPSSGNLTPHAWTKPACHN